MITEIQDPGATPLAPAYRAATLGIVGLVSLIAFEAMGNATVMPAAATALDGLSLYGSAFGVPLAASIIGMVAAGRWSDSHGPMRAVRAGGLCFVTGLLLAAAAGSMHSLLFARLITGLGSGMLAVALYALVGRVYPPALHPKIFAAFSAAWILPSLLAPGLNGLVAQSFGWRWAFVITALLALPIFALLARVRVARVAPQGASGRGPGRGRMLWALAAAGSALLLHQLGQTTFRAGTADGSRLAACIGVAALGLLLLAARRLLPAGSLRAHRGLPAAISLSALSQGAFFSAEAFIPLLLQRERGLSLGLAGLVLTVGAVSWSMGAAYRARVHQRISATLMLKRGLLLLAVGIGISAAVLVTGVPTWLAVAGWAAAGAGMGLVSPTLSIMTLALSPEGKHGHTGASLRLSAAMATTATLAVSGAIFAGLLDTAPTAAFAISLGLAASLALCGALIASRTQLRAAEA